MSDEPRFMALRCTVEHGEHPLDEHGRITLADPDGDIWAWPSEHVAPWMSVKDVEAIGRLVETTADLAEEAINYGDDSVLLDGRRMQGVRDALAALVAIRNRLGWP